uniref:hypothetical protein n=1 Tax=Candidatus Scatousia sp. TaxID=3085663 RepID=UPI004025E613
MELKKLHETLHSDGFNPLPCPQRGQGGSRQRVSGSYSVLLLILPLTLTNNPSVILTNNPPVILN